MGENVKHFGGGQTEAELKLAKDTHTLQLIMNDQYHIPCNSAVVSKKVTVTVK